MTRASALELRVRGQRPGRPARGRASRAARYAPYAVAAAFTLVQLVAVVPGAGLGWDETVYVSQLGQGAPAAYFSAPRARGISLLTAPVTTLASSVTALHSYLALLSGAALCGALLLWRRLLPPAAVALAGVLFGGLWITLLYGPQAMPNLWVALGALYAVGFFLHAAEARAPAAGSHAPAADRRTPARNPRAPAARSPALAQGPRSPATKPLLGLAAALAFVALMRPSDSLWLAAPLLLGAVCVRRWRRPALVTVIVAGTVAGCAPWVVEAYLSYGGPGERLHRAAEIQGRLGPHLALDDQVRSLDGRTLCRPCDGPWRHPVTALWWFALPVLTAAGVLAAARLRRTAAVTLPALAGLSLAVPYLLLIGYAAPRFLLPAYALLALPTALALTRAPALARRPAPVAALLALLLAGHLAVQYAVLRSATARARESRAAFDAVTAELRRHGVRPPCAVSGAEAVRVAYRLGCASRQTAGHDRSTTPAELTAFARAHPVAVVVPSGTRAPAYTRGWRTHPLPGLPGLEQLRVRLSPSTRP